MKTLTRILCTFLLFSLLYPIGYAEKANFKLAEKFATDNLRTLVGSRSVNANWLHKSDKFWYQYKTSVGTKYYIVDPARRSKTPLFDNQAMAAKISAITKKGYDHKNLPIKKLKFKDNNREFTFKVDKDRFLYNLDTKKLTKADKDKKEKKDKPWKKLSPDKKWIVFAKNHNLFIMKAEEADKKDPKEYQLTTDGEQWYSFARTRGVDFKKDKPMPCIARWFEDSKKLYVIRSDRRKVGDLWLVHTLDNPRPTLETYKDPLAGDKHVPQTELMVFDIETRKKVKIDTKKWKDQTIRTFSSKYNGVKTSGTIYFTRSDRPLKKVEFCAADTGTGKVTVLLEEESHPYINFQFTQAYILSGGKGFTWWSERDGWGHFYLYNNKGKLIRRLTSGNYMAGRIAKVDEKKRLVYFSAYGKEKDFDPYYNIYYRVSLDGGPIKKLTPENATHSFDMTESMNYFVDNYSRVDLVPVSVLRDSSGNVVLKLETMDVSRLKAYGWQPPVPFKVKADDGITDLYGVMWKPYDLDPKKKYPVISYCYPGPQSEPVPKTFFLVRNERVHNIPIAQLGFIVVTVGQRGGSPVRAKWYHNYGHGNARDYPLADNKAAIENLANRYPFMDISRVGIYGRSGGGFMSTAAILKYPDFYDAAFSSCGNHDNNVYHYSWGEPHYGLEEALETIKESGKKEADKSKENEKENKEEKKETVFKAKFPTNPELARNLKGKLMLIHGEVDNNVHPANTMRMADALIKAGKRFEFMIFPGKRHAYGEYTRYIERLMWYFFAEHLKGDYRSNTDIYMKH